MASDERGVEIHERPNSLTVHRNAAGAWSTEVKVYFGNEQENGEAAKEWLDALNLRLLATYPPVDEVQAAVLERRLEISLTAAKERNDNS